MKDLRKNKTSILILLTVVVIALLILIIGIRIKSKSTLTMLIIGDSISVGAGASEPEHKWWKRLSTSIKDLYGIDIEITNDSLGGNDTYSAYCRLMRALEKSEYDIILICSGANDYHDLDLHYENLLLGISRKSPNSTVFSVLESSERENFEKIDIIQNLSSYYGVETIDMIKAFEESGYSYDKLSDDGVHPNDLGQDIYLSETIKSFSSHVSKGHFLSEAINQVSSPLNPETKNWGDYSFISLEDMKMINDLEYELSLPDSTIMLGSDYFCFKGNNYFEVSSKGTVLFTRNINRDDEEESEFNYLENINCEVDGTLTIVFSSEEMKNHFKGLNITKRK